jgi:hypothetical protein
LAFEVCFGAFLNSARDLAHPLVSRRKTHDLLDKKDRSAQADEATQQGNQHALGNKKSG